MITTVSERASARRMNGRPLLCIAAVLAASQLAHGQSSIFGTNLIVNGDAEAGPAGTSTTDVVTTIPNWTKTGNVNVLSYGLTGLVLLNDPTPPDHAFQYFSAAGSKEITSTLTQVIDVSSGASTISGGNVKFTASAYLGSTNGSNEAAQMTLSFQNGAGQPFNAVTLGPLGFPSSGMSLQQSIGLVPAGTTQIAVTLSLNSDCPNAATCRYAAADSLSVVLMPLGSGSVLGTNLVVNGDAETGTGVPSPNFATNIPGWSTDKGASVSPYGGYQGFITATDPGPAHRGVNLFYGGPVASTSDMYQDIDVSPSATAIDAGQVQYEIAAWLGGLAHHQSPTLTYVFYDWSGKPLAPTSQLGPASVSTTTLLSFTQSGNLPSGTRRVHIALSFHFGINGGDTGGSLADNISFTLAGPSGPPVINPGGIVSASSFGAFPSVAPGSWIEIYGADLAAATQNWSGSDFVNNVAPTSLGGVSVSVGGHAAFLDYVSATQVNALVPSDAPTGVTPVTVTNANGTSDSYWITVNPLQPGLLAPSSFLIGGKQYVAALFADGTYVLPEGALAGVNSRPAQAGDEIVLYGVGFGEVEPGTQAGQLVQQSNTLANSFEVSINKISVKADYAGLAPSYTGLYQFNIPVPTNPGNGAVPLTFTLNGAAGTQTLYLAVSK